MHDDLVKRLRNAAQWADKGLVITPSVCLEAADAIEDLQKRKHGKWERNYDGIFYWWECSECHHDAWYDKEDLTNFCPNCGADMRGEDDV